VRVETGKVVEANDGGERGLILAGIAPVAVERWFAGEGVGGPSTI